LRHHHRLDRGAERREMIDYEALALQPRERRGRQVRLILDQQDPRQPGSPQPAAFCLMNVAYAKLKRARAGA
jgi:hypothetical protein